MSAPRKPLGVTAERAAELLERDPTAEFGWRWRRRPRSMFRDDESGERTCAVWNTRFAGKAVGKRNKGQVLFTIDHATYDLRRIEEELGEAVDAITGSSVGSPGDENTGGIAGDSGSLAKVIRAATSRSGLRLSDLTVLSVKRDPYRVDTPQGHREGRWFAQWLHELFPGVVVHLRGLHYALVSKGGVTKPDGTPYENNIDDFTWLIDDAAKAARWLDYIDFDHIVDQRNDKPVECRRSPEPASTPIGTVSATIFDGSWALHLSGEIEVKPPTIETWAVGGEASMSTIACKPYAVLSGVEASEQPYAFAFFGEKSSLREVLAPIAQEYGANMYLCSGEISDTLIYHMAKDADEDGRPLVVFTFSDFDPAGHQMPISIGRKLQALRDFQFPSLRAEVAPVSLTLEQVIAERLPTTPVKSKEKRGKKWNEAFGPAMREVGLITGSRPAQVEIDALAVIRPDVLRRITHEKIALYRDETVERRARAVRERWHAEARPVVEAQLVDHQERLDEIKQAAEEAVKEFNTARDELVEVVDAAKEIFLESFEEARQAFVDTVSEPKEALDEAHSRLQEVEADLREVLSHIRVPAPPPPLQPEIDLDRQAPIVRLDWSFEDVTAALKARKAYENDDDAELAS